MSHVDAALVNLKTLLNETIERDTRFALLDAPSANSRFRVIRKGTKTQVHHFPLALPSHFRSIPTSAQLQRLGFIKFPLQLLESLNPTSASAILTRVSYKDSFTTRIRLASPKVLPQFFSEPGNEEKEKIKCQSFWNSSGNLSYSMMRVVGDFVDHEL